MLILNKVMLLPNLQAVNDVLNTHNYEPDNNLYNCKYIYETKFAIKQYKKENMNIIRIWKTNVLFDYWYDDFNRCGKNWIGSLDYTIHDTYIKINYLNINDYEKGHIYNYPLDIFDAEDLIKSLINFLKLVAEKEKKNKIILDVHKNLRLYKNYYYYEGFIVTNRKCSTNPYWIEVEMNLINN